MTDKKTDRISVSLSPKLKEQIRAEGKERGLTMTGFLLSCRAFFLQLEASNMKLYARTHGKHERPWDEPAPKKSRHGRILPAIPGTPQYKALQETVNRNALMDELKTKLKKRIDDW